MIWSKAKRDEAQFQRGYAYAAGQLLTFRCDPANLARIEAEADDPWDYANAFGRGMQSAIAAFVLMTEGVHCIQTPYGEWVPP